MRLDRIFGAAAALGIIALVACHSSRDETSASATGTSSSYIAGVTLGGTAATFTGTPVPPPNGGPDVTLATGNPVVVNGGTNQFGFTSTAGVARLYVFVNGLAGYYDVPVPAPGTSGTMLVSYQQSIPTSTFSFAVAGVSASGTVGTPAIINTVVTTVGTGEVQIALSWDVNSDVDLHVIEPSGEELYWNSRVSATGGKLDLDSNAACTIDGIRAENVTWATGTAPRGTYTVKVDLWSNCGATTSTNYVVRTTHDGNSTNFTGTLTGSGDRGGRGSGTLVTTFTH